MSVLLLGILAIAGGTMAAIAASIAFALKQEAKWEAAGKTREAWYSA